MSVEEIVSFVQHDDRGPIRSELVVPHILTKPTADEVDRDFAQVKVEAQVTEVDSQ